MNSTGLGPHARVTNKARFCPQVLLAEAVFFGKRATKRVTASIVVVCLGVGLSTVTDTQARSLHLCAGAGTLSRFDLETCQRGVRLRLCRWHEEPGSAIQHPRNLVAAHRPSLSRDVAQAAKGLQARLQSGV